MEENTKTVEMKATKANDAKKTAPEKPTYEQLNDWLNQAIMQNRELAQKLNQVMNIQNKLPSLFKVLENEAMFDADFVAQCSKEIQEILTPPDNSKENTEEE